MKTRTLLSIALVLLIIISGCTSVKRFKSASYKGEDHSLVEMDLFSARLENPGPDPGGKNLWDLSASAQTQMIQILHERYPDNGQFFGALNQEYLQKGAGPLTDYTPSNLRMVFTIKRQHDHSALGKGEALYSPADRIESLKFSLRIPEEANLHFTGWNRYTTEYGEIEIAELSFSRSLEMDAELSGEIADGSIKNSVVKSEEQVVSSRYLKLSGSISDHSLEMVEEGTRGADLTGNVLADVSLRFDGFPERVTIPLYAGEAEGGIAVVTDLKFADVLVPRMEDAPDVITGVLQMEYIYRHVESGWKTFQEWDDRVAFYKGTKTKEVTLFEKQDYLPPLFCIGRSPGQEKVRIRSGTGAEYPLQFRNHVEAGRFLEWLEWKSQDENMNPGASIVIGEHILMLGKQDLTHGILQGRTPLKVMRVY